MMNRAVVIDVDDRQVYKELCQAAFATDSDVLERDPESLRLIVGGDHEIVARRLTKQAHAAKAGDRDDLLTAARTAKTRLREAEREMKR